MNRHAQFYIGGRWAGACDSGCARRHRPVDRAAVHPDRARLQGGRRPGGRRRQSRLRRIFAHNARGAARAAPPNSRKLQRPGGGPCAGRLAGNGRSLAVRPRGAGLGGTGASRSDHRGARELRIQPAARNEPDRQGADRRRRADHAVELAFEPDRLQGRSGAGRRLHGGPEAERDRPDQRDPVRRDRRGFRRPGRRLQSPQRHGSGGRAGHGGPSRRRHGVLHRIDPRRDHRRQGGGGHGQAGRAGAGRQVAEHHPAGRGFSGRGAGGGPRLLLQQRAVVRRPDPNAGPGRIGRTTRWRSPPKSPPRRRSAIRASRGSISDRS